MSQKLMMKGGMDLSATMLAGIIFGIAVLVVMVFVGYTLIGSGGGTFERSAGGLVETLFE